MSRPARPGDIDEICRGLAEVDRDELEEILTDAWAACAPKRLVREHLGG